MRLSTAIIAILLIALVLIVALAPRATAQSADATIRVGLEWEVSGELTAADGGSDWYAFEVTGGKPYIIEAKPAYTFGDDGDVSLVPGYIVDVSILGIRDGGGATLLGEHDQGGFTLNAARAFFVPPADGTYSIGVGAGAQDRTALGHYTVSVRLDDHPDDYQTPPSVVLRPGESIEAVINSDVAPDDERLPAWAWSPVGWSDIPRQQRPRTGIESLDDRDVFRFEIAIEGIYRLHVENELIEVAVEHDGPAGIWEVDDDMGNLYFYPPDGPAASFVYWYGPGTYYVEIGTAYESSGNTLGYTVSLDAFPWTDEQRADCPPGVPTGCALQVGRATTGVIEGIHDQDAWSVHLDAGRTYVVDVLGADEDSGGDPGGTLSDPALLLTDGTNHPLALGDAPAAGGQNVRATYIVPTNAGGPYGIVVRRSTSTTPKLATYTILVEEVDAPPLDEAVDCPRTRPTHCSIAVGESKRGEIERTTDGSLDADAWTVQLDSGKRYVIEVRGAGDRSGGNDNGGTLPDPVVELTTEVGIALASNDNVSEDNANARLALPSAADTGGTYVIFVGGGDAADGSPGTYTLTVRLAPDRTP